ncbi:hypothetical protein GCM10009546_39460 [Actinomadura livida]|uniref:Uncharacterized protein n=2 Tax=Actinomadura livida TaxID=79909 RepID=A0ABP3PSY4_9ACTN|nr:hypothetical protein GCM10010208_48980 [Actinomadura livida]
MAEWDGEALARLRGAVHRGDGGRGLEVLAGRPLGPVLQYAGDVAVAARGLPGGAALARECVEELRRRGLPGDAELADEIEGVSGLAGLPVDLGAVAAAMDDGFHVLDVEYGDVVPVDEGGEGVPIPPGVLPEGEDARRGAARRWLAEQGYRAVPRGL